MNRIEITMPYDLCGRMAAFVCQEFSHISNPIRVEFNGRAVPASSRLGVETLGVRHGDTIFVIGDINETTVNNIFQSHV